MSHQRTRPHYYDNSHLQLSNLRKHMHGIVLASLHDTPVLSKHASGPARCSCWCPIMPDTAMTMPK